MALLYCYCDGCGRRIEIGETAYELGDHLPDAEYSGLTFCENCCKAINTKWWWERQVEAEESLAALAGEDV